MYLTDCTVEISSSSRFSVQNILVWMTGLVNPKRPNVKPFFLSVFGLGIPRAWVVFIGFHDLFLDLDAGYDRGYDRS